MIIEEKKTLKKELQNFEIKINSTKFKEREMLVEILDKFKNI